MRILPFLEEAAGLEDVISLCYGGLAALTGDSALSEELKRFERDENNHANVIRTGKNYALRMPDVFGEANIEYDELRSGAGESRTLLEDIRSGRVAFKDALTRLYDLESRFEKIHLATIVNWHDATLEKLFQQMSKDERDHCETMAGILKRMK